MHLHKPCATLCWSLNDFNPTWRTYGGLKNWFRPNARRSGLRNFIAGVWVVPSEWLVDSHPDTEAETAQLGRIASELRIRAQG